MLKVLRSALMRAIFCGLWVFRPSVVYGAGVEDERLIAGLNKAGRGVVPLVVFLLFFAGVLLFSLVGIGDRELYLQSGWEVAQIGVEFVLDDAAIYLPGMFLFVHLVLLLMLDAVWRRVCVLRGQVSVDVLQLRLHPVAFVHTALPGAGLGVRLVTFLGVLLVPLLVLAGVMVAFIRYQDETIWQVQWVYLLLDFVLVCFFCVRLYFFRSMEKPGQSLPRIRQTFARNSLNMTLLVLALLTCTAVFGFTGGYGKIPSYAIGDSDPNSATSTNLLDRLCHRRAFQRGLGCRRLKLNDMDLFVVDEAIATTVSNFEKRLKERSEQDLTEIQIKFAQRRDFKGRNFRYGDLRGSRLWGSNFQGADFGKAVLQNTQMQHVDLSGARLPGALLRKARMQGVVLRQAQLLDAVLWDAQLQGADLRQVVLQGADLRGAQLQGAVLWDAQLRGADLRDAQLQWAQLQDVDLRQAKMQGVDLRDAQLQGADLRQVHLQSATLWSAQILGADLREARLQGADLRYAQLTGSDLRRARLQGTFLWQTQLQGADLRKAQLHGAQLQGADLREATMQGADFRRTQLQGAILMGARLLDVDFAEAQVIGANWSGANVGGARGGGIEGLSYSYIGCGTVVAETAHADEVADPAAFAAQINNTASINTHMVLDSLFGRGSQDRQAGYFCAAGQLTPQNLASLNATATEFRMTTAEYAQFIRDLAVAQGNALACTPASLRQSKPSTAASKRIVDGILCRCGLAPPADCHGGKSG